MGGGEGGDGAGGGGDGRGRGGEGGVGDGGGEGDGGGDEGDGGGEGKEEANIWTVSLMSMQKKVKTRGKKQFLQMRFHFTVVEDVVKK